MQRQRERKYIHVADTDLFIMSICEEMQKQTKFAYMLSIEESEGRDLTNGKRYTR